MTNPTETKMNKHEDYIIHSNNQVTVRTITSPSKGKILNLSITKCIQCNLTMNNENISIYISPKKHSNLYEKARSIKYSRNETIILMNCENNSAY